MANVDLDDANAVWQQLTDAERLDFEKIIHSEDVSKLMEINEPWWNHRTTKPLIEDLSSAPKVKSATVSPPVPEIHRKISSFSTVASKPPSPCLRHNVANVLAAYSVTHRFFNGEHLASCHESCTFLLAICANLKANANFDDDQLAIDAVVHDCGTEHVALEDGQDTLIRDDVQAILGGPDGSSSQYTLAALSDVHRMLTGARKRVTTEAPAQGEFSKRFMDHHQRVATELVDRTKLTGCAKKLEFYLSFVKSGWGSTSPLVAHK